MRYYFIGICGISMSALANFVKNQGNFVSGCDLTQNIPSSLQGISVYQSAIGEVERADIVVVSSAIKVGNVDYDYAVKLNKTILSRGELLGKIASSYKKVIAVAGSHGKTTTTALIYNVLKVANLSPTLHLGGILCEENTNFVIGHGEYFVTEACEYFDNFLFLHPYLGVITNIEKEHMDYFKTFSRELKSFQKFKSQCEHVVQNKLTCDNVRHDKSGRLCFDIFEGDKKLLSLKMNICEDVNTQNALNAYCACKVLGLENDAIKCGLETFRGVKSRFERVECKNFKNAIVDYAHHPTEIRNTIKTAKSMFMSRFVIVFQPHTYSRTKTLLNEFLSVFEGVENLIIFKTYSARESEADGVSGERLCELINMKKRKKCAKYAENNEKLQEILAFSYDFSYSVIFVGAGDLLLTLRKEGFIN